MAIDQKDLKIWLETGVWLGIPNYELELRSRILAALAPTYTEIIDLLKQVAALQKQLDLEKRKNTPKIIEKPTKRSVAIKATKTPVKKPTQKKRGS